MPFLVVSLGVATGLIAVICVVWMRASRASQQRMELHNQRIISLLEEQNELLKQASHRS